MEPAVAGELVASARRSRRCCRGTSRACVPGTNHVARIASLASSSRIRGDADPRPELAVRDLDRRVAPPDAVGHRVVIEGQGDGQARAGSPRVLGDGAAMVAVVGPRILRIDMATRARLLPDPRRRAQRDRRRDQERLPQARPAVASGRQQGSGRGRPVQGDQRGLPGPVRPAAPAALRHVRAGRLRRRCRRRGFEGFGGFARHLRCVLRWRRRRRRPRGRPQAGSDLRYDLRITFEEAVRGTEKEIEFRVLARARRAAAMARSRAPSRHLPAVQRPRRDPVDPPDDARPDGQRDRLPALPRRRQDHRDAVRDVPRRRPHRAQADPAGHDPGRASTRATRSASRTRARSGRAAGRPAACTSPSTSAAPDAAPRGHRAALRGRRRRSRRLPSARAITVPTVDGDEEVEIKAGPSRAPRSGSAAAACRTCAGAGSRGDLHVLVDVVVPAKLSKRQREPLDALRRGGRRDRDRRRRPPGRVRDALG